MRGAITVARHFDPGEEDQEILGPYEFIDSEGRVIQKLTGQHPLVGFHVENSIIELCADIGLSIGFDEYADEYE